MSLGAAPKYRQGLYLSLARITYSYPVSVKDMDILRGLSPQRLMKNFSRVIFVLLFLLFTGGGIFLALWEIPAPTQTIERDLSHVRFPR